MSAASQKELLNSWKEIATYLNRGVRTVQRWEVELGLPVRRPRAKNRSAVIAMRSEIDEWLKACPVTEREKTRGAEIRVAVPPKLPLTTLLVKSHELQHTVSRSREELGASLNRLMTTLEKMVQQ